MPDILRAIAGIDQDQAVVRFDQLSGARDVAQQA